ncbi:MAG: urease accessory protein UreF, partial [Dehalococcoidia bacterium]
ALQLADSFFPLGMYAHSHGLEGMVRRGLVRSAPEVAEFLENQFRWSVLPSDGVALLEAYRATEQGDLAEIVSLDQLLLSMKSPSELRTASTQFGHRVLTETKDWIANPLREEYARRVITGSLPGNGAVALGVTGGSLGLGARTALMVFCHSHAVSILGAASRLLPFSHTQAQEILRRLHPLLDRLAGEIWDRPWRDMTAFTPQLDLVAMGHETDELRLFAS